MLGHFGKEIFFSQRRGEIEENMRFEVRNWLMVTKQSPTNLGLSFIFGGGCQLSGSVSNPFQC